MYAILKHSPTTQLSLIAKEKYDEIYQRNLPPHDVIILNVHSYVFPK